MEKYLLNGIWNMKILGRDEGFPGAEGIRAKIPGSVISNLLEQGLIEDPYYRANELGLLPLMDNDFLFETEFSLKREQLDADALYLRFGGIDTIADIFVNDIKIGHTENMHRSYEFDLFSEAGEEGADGMINGIISKGFVNEGRNTLKVLIQSPVRYIREEQAKVYTGGASESMEGFPHIRKAHCMFGWDWGPRIPDAGIFRDVSLLEVRGGRILNVHIRQEHSGELPDGSDRRVKLTFDPQVRFYGATAGRRENDRKNDIGVIIELISPEGESRFINEVFTYGKTYELTVDEPKLWWPRGYGEQPLYEVKVTITGSRGPEGEEALDSYSSRIGLRTMTVNTDEDEYGQCFAHEVNGLKVFAMGADYIPEDNLLSRVTPERTRHLLEEAAWANHNAIRVWGGGYYPDDHFYDSCDELGLMVWQDFMFACESVELDEAFEENVTEEIRENILRIRHHACLALWCGNNEMETQTLDGSWHPSMKQRGDYTKLFEYIIPKLVRENDPDTFYWPSSPSSGGNWDNPWDEHRGDAHYWDVWHGEKPFTDYRNYRFRYLSEFGFQSFPELRSIEYFTEPSDRNLFSYVMEMHQRNRAANGKILKYLSASYLYPKDFEMTLYASQLLQADAIRYGVEHFRRFRGECMGTLVWQLNDIWPGASWSSIDSLGRRKALHYAEKRMFAPVMISCEETGELSERPFCIEEPTAINKGVRLHVANETSEPVSGVVRWSLRNPDSSVIMHGREGVSLSAFSGEWLDYLDLSEYNEHIVHFSYGLDVNGVSVSEGSVLLTPPKHYEFEDPGLEVTVSPDRKELTVHAKAFAKGVWIKGTDADLFLSDNFFDMEAGEKTVRIEKGEASEAYAVSVYDIAKA